MPLLQYRCKICGKRFEELVKSHTDEVLCPDCKTVAERDWSGVMYSSTGKSHSAGKESGEGGASGTNRVTARAHCHGDCKHCRGC